jgi:hypothetical protein
MAWVKYRGKYRMGINKRERKRYRTGNIYNQVANIKKEKPNFYKQGGYILKQEDYDSMNIADKILNMCEQDVNDLPHAQYSTSMTKGQHIYGMGLSQEEDMDDEMDMDYYEEEDEDDMELPEISDTENLEVALLAELEEYGLSNVDVDPDGEGGYTMAMIFETGDYLSFHLFPDVNHKPTMMAIAGEGLTDQVLMPINFITNTHEVSIMDLQGFPFEFVKSMVKKYVMNSTNESLMELYIPGKRVGQRVVQVRDGVKRVVKATRKKLRRLTSKQKQHLKALGRKRKGKKLRGDTKRKRALSLRKRKSMGLDKKK